MVTQSVTPKVLAYEGGRKKRMKVTKRDGRIVEYDRNKIIIAIQKANAEVDRYEQVTEEKLNPLLRN